MSVAYKYLTENERDDMIARELIAAERSMVRIELRYAQCKAALADMAREQLPEQWPANLKVLIDAPPAKLAAAKLSPEDQQLFLLLKKRDKLIADVEKCKADQLAAEQRCQLFETLLPDVPRRDRAVGRVRNSPLNPA